MLLKLPLAAGVLVVTMLGACADPPPGGRPPGSDDDALRYEANVTVLESAEHGPELCLGAIAESYPPQCGGVPITNWNWDGVEAEESASGTTWGSFHVVGTYDGTSFAMIEAGPVEPSEPMSDVDPVDTPCPEPDGGWVASDPDRATDADMTAAVEVVRNEPDFAGVWVDYVEEPVGRGPIPPGGIILNVAFTGDLDRQTTDVAQLWGGPLCVVQHEFTLVELTRIQRELGSDAAADLGIQVVASGVYEQLNQVIAEVVVADDEARQAVEALYGPGAVRLNPAFTPVEG